MHKAPKHVRVIACAIACVAFLLSAGAAVAVAQDFVERDALPPGSAVADVRLGGAPISAARQALQRDLLAPLDEPVTVVCGETSVEIRPAQFVRVDLDRALQHLAQTKAEAGLARRLAARISRGSYGAAVPPQMSVDRSALDSWVAELASRVGTPAVDATLVVQSRQLVAVPERPGFTVDPRRAADALAIALAAGQKRVELPVVRSEPRVTRDDLGTAILVRRADRRLFLYEDGRLVKTYRVAVGAPSFPTPRGRFKIIRKRYMPTWGNPGSAWAADMPKMIPPGPNNPLGTRALDLDAPGIRIHGTNKDYSIGTAASHGCMRMHRWDIEDLYERVSVGTPVFIID
ncbi:MAG: L,D-transpeptidase family protein [Anaerosomatales bacterium]|nr:L,D-transpeptidase family protein [Anaerosomatales bacterium]